MSPSVGSDTSEPTPKNSQGIAITLEPSTVYLTRRNDSSAGGLRRTTAEEVKAAVSANRKTHKQETDEHKRHKACRYGRSSVEDNGLEGLVTAPKEAASEVAPVSESRLVLPTVEAK